MNEESTKLSKREAAAMKKFIDALDDWELDKLNEDEAVIYTWREHGWPRLDISWGPAMDRAMHEHIYSDTRGGPCAKAEFLGGCSAEFFETGGKSEEEALEESRNAVRYELRGFIEILFEDIWPRQFDA